MEKSTVPYAVVVDDDPMILMDAHDILEDAGFRVYDADTAHAAIELLGSRAESVTLLFTDVEMPGPIDGFALARHVDREWPHIEIVIASGRVTPEPRDLPDKASFIGKPYNARLVHSHLREKLPDAKSRRHSRRLPNLNAHQRKATLRQVWLTARC